MQFQNAWNLHLFYFMPRKQLILTDEYPYHVINRANNKEFFYIELQDLWEIFEDHFKKAKEIFKCEIHAFVLMGNHFHLLISTPNKNLGEVMKYLQREVARNVNKKTNRINHVFGGRYKWSLIQQETYYWNVIKYVFRNPVRSGIADNVLNYPFSSLEKTDYPLIDFWNQNKKIHSLDLDWLNEPFLKEKEDAIKKALRRKVFELPKDENKKLMRLDEPRSKKGTVT